MSLEVTALSSKRFKATIAQSGPRVLLRIPFNPNEAWGVKQHHYVSGSINGCKIRGRLESAGTEYFLPLGAAWRRDNGIDAGARVEVALAPDGPQSDSLAADVSAALGTQPEARTFFDALAPFYRNNYVRWIESAKRPETRTVRIAEMIGLLKAGKKQR